MTHTVHSTWFEGWRTFATMLEAMREGRVFAIEPQPDGRFEFFEHCDECFGVFVTRSQLLALADELRELAGPPVEPQQHPVQADRKVLAEVLSVLEDIDECEMARLRGRGDEAIRLLRALLAA